MLANGHDDTVDLASRGNFRWKGRIHPVMLEAIQSECRLAHEKNLCPFVVAVAVPFGAHEQRPFAGPYDG